MTRAKMDDMEGDEGELPKKNSKHQEEDEEWVENDDDDALKFNSDDSGDEDGMGAEVVEKPVKTGNEPIEGLGPFHSPGPTLGKKKSGVRNLMLDVASILIHSIAHMKITCLTLHHF
jgi:hypothetical protein